MYPPAKPVQLPNSYAKLDLPDIKITNVPESADCVTPVQLLHLYRPNNHNAFTHQMQESISEFYTLINADDRVKVVVLTGKSIGWIIFTSSRVYGERQAMARCFASVPI
jgi:1,4-dihydroxy-2-naphthoyl-CoA synthase